MDPANSATHQSRVKPSLDFNNRKFLVCLASGGSILGGHAIITVEGLKNDGSLYQRVCDITACAGEENSVIQESLGNRQGYIDRIRVYEEFKGGFDYSSLKAESWYAPLEKIEALMSHIVEKKKRLEKAREDKQPSPFKYQTAGSRRLWIFGSNGGENCLTWSQRELIDAYILSEADAVKKLDLVKAAPHAHISGEHHTQ